MFSKLFAVCLLVEDFGKSFDFYKNKLELKLNTKEGKFANFKLGETELAIFQKDEASGMFPRKYMKSGGGSVIGFQVDDLIQSCKEMKSRGIVLFEGPKKTDWGQEVAYFTDPDDNIWEVSKRN